MNLHLYQFSLTCRDCLNSSPNEHILQIDSETHEMLNNSLTEYAILNKLQSLGAFDNIMCSTCESSNVMLYRLKYHNKSIGEENILQSYKDGKIAVYIKLEKFGNRFKHLLKFSQNCNLNDHIGILELLFQEVIETTFNQSDNIFDSSIGGQSEIVLVGERSMLGTITNLNKFNNIGLTRNDIFKCIYDITEKYPINIKLDKIDNSLSKEDYSTNRDLHESVPFKGAIMNEAFYLDSLEQASELDLPYSNVCWSTNDIIIAHGTAYDESPANFYEKHKMDYFIIEPNPNPRIFNGKMLYYATILIS